VTRFNHSSRNGKARATIHPRIALLLLRPVLLVACARATKEIPTQEGAPAIKAPTALQGDFRVHDPSMIKQDGAYYVFSTGDEGGLNRGTIQIRRSTDLASWKLIGTIFPSIPEWIGKELGKVPPGSLCRPWWPNDLS
jgi:hypothetical protein